MSYRECLGYQIISEICVGYPVHVKRKIKGIQRDLPEIDMWFHQISQPSVLQLFRPPEHRFLVGLFSQPITVFPNS